MRGKGTERLTGRSVEFQVQGIVGQSRRPETPHYRGGNLRSHRSVDVADRQHQRLSFAVLQRGRQLRQKRSVERFFQLMILSTAVAADSVFLGRAIQHSGEIHPGCFGIVRRRPLLQQITASDQILKARNAERRHNLAYFFGDEEKVIHDMLRPSLKTPTQHRILRSNPHRTSVEMALSHHEAAFHHQGSRRKTEFVRP